MRKALWSAAALVALLSGAGLMLGGAAVRAADTTVNMVDGPGDPTAVWKFEPAEITVPAGSKVIWKNTGDQPHTATADDGSFDSGYLSNGGEFSQVVTKSITYKCEPHPWMTGKINVTGGAATPPAAPATTTTTAKAGGTTPTTAAAAGSTTTTTAKAAGGSTTTTTAAAGVTPTTQAAAATPPSAPENAGVTTTTAAHSVEAGTGEEHASGESKKDEDDDDDKSSPIGIAFAGASTMVLAGISGKLLASKS